MRAARPRPGHVLAGTSLRNHPVRLRPCLFQANRHRPARGAGTADGGGRSWPHAVVSRQYSRPVDIVAAVIAWFLARVTLDGLSKNHAMTLIGPDTTRRYRRSGPTRTPVCWTTTPSEPVTGKETERIGLVSAAVVPRDVLDTALDIAQRTAAGPQHALRWTKRSIIHWLRTATKPSRPRSASSDQLLRARPRRGPTASRTAHRNFTHPFPWKLNLGNETGCPATLRDFRMVLPTWSERSLGNVDQVFESETT